jgi:transcriptional regulator GlxA family with amidase domain
MERLILSFEAQKRPMPVGQFLMDAVRSRPLQIVDGPALSDTAQLIPASTGQFSREQIRALLALLLVQLANLLSPAQKAQPKETSLDTGRVACIDDYINRCFAQNAGEEELAALLGLSRRQLDRVMHRHYGMGFREKVGQIRLDVACDLLRRASLSVEQVALRVGYSTASNFTVFFKRHLGQTPSEYRKSLKM